MSNIQQPSFTSIVLDIESLYKGFLDFLLDEFSATVVTVTACQSDFLFFFFIQFL